METRLKVIAIDMDRNCGASIVNIETCTALDQSPLAF
jgi:hypothetical protein